MLFLTLINTVLPLFCLKKRNNEYFFFSKSESYSVPESHIFILQNFHQTKNQINICKNNYFFICFYIQIKICNKLILKNKVYVQLNQILVILTQHLLIRDVCIKIEI